MSPQQGMPRFHTKVETTDRDGLALSTDDPGPWESGRVSPGRIGTKMPMPEIKCSTGAQHIAFASPTLQDAWFLPGGGLRGATDLWRG